MGNTAAFVTANDKSEMEGRERFVAMFNERYAHYFEFLGGRTSGKGKARLRCKVCGHEFERFGNFVRMDTNLFCPRCHVHRDDEINVPTDGNLAEHLGILYASGLSCKQVMGATGIQERYVRMLVNESCKAEHDETLRALRNAQRLSQHQLQCDVLSALDAMRSEIKGGVFAKELSEATRRVDCSFKCFEATAEFVERYAPTHATCKHCGKDYLFFPSTRKFGRKKAGPYCSRRCNRKHNRSSSNISHRLRKHGSADKPRDAIRLDDVIERDHGICYICGCKATKQDHYFVHGHFTAGDSYPTIDHVTPIAKGGTHTWGNVRLACMKCNREKRDS